MNKILIFALFMIMFIVTACTSSLDITSENETNVSLDLSDELTSENSSIPAPTSGCTEEWKCISSTVKAYQYENCSYGTRKTCPSGCSNNTCKAAEVCTSGFKCHGNYYKGYQLEIEHEMERLRQYNSRNFFTTYLTFWLGLSVLKYYLIKS